MPFRPVQIAGFFVLFYFSICFFPPPPWPVGPGLDPSWVLGFNLAHAKHLIFGTDVVFTYGPLVYTMLPAFPQAEVWHVWAYHMGLFALWAQAIIRLQFAVKPKILAFGIGVALCIVSTLMGLLPPDRIVITAGVVTILILARLPRKSVLDLVMMGVFAGLMLLVKFNLGVSSLALYVCLVVICNLPLRVTEPRFWLTLGGYFAIPLACSFVAYGLVSGTVWTFVAFLRNSMEVASGYSESMSYAGPMWQVALAIASILGLLGIAIYLCRRSPLGLAACVPAALFLYFTFKSAIVRQDPYHAALFELNAAIATTFILVCVSGFRERLVLSIAAVVFAVLGFLVIRSTTPEQSTAVLSRLRGEHSLDFLGAYSHFSRYAEASAAQEPGLLAPSKLPDTFRNAIGSDTVDDFTYSVDRVGANHLNWDPRPTFQSYSAYTPLLDHLNAAHFERASRPRKILWEWMTIDNRYLPADEPLVFSAILNHYDIAVASPDMVVMQARPTERFTKPVDLPSAWAEMGKPFGVPRVAWNELSILRAEIHENLVGKLWTFLYRGDPMGIEATMYSGSQVHNNVIWRNMADGVIASDWFAGLPDLETALQGSSEGVSDRVASLRFVAPRPLFFDSRVELKWSKVGISTAMPLSMRPKPVPAPQLSTETLWTPQDGLPIANNCAVTLAGGDLKVVASNVDPQLLFPIGPRMGTFHTLIVRAKFQVRDELEAFFGRQVDGRGYRGEGTIVNRWVDVYIPVAANEFWKDEHGTWLRFDPTSGRGVGTTTQIRAILGSAKEMQGSQIQVFPASEVKDR